MKRAIVTSLVLLALSTNLAAAGAHEFLASSTGKITLKLLTNAVFHNAAGNMDCTGASIVNGAVTTTKSVTLVSTFQFEKCKAFGLNMAISPVNVRSTADGSVSLLKPVTAKALECLIVIPTTKNQNLKTIKYNNTNKQIEKVAGVTLIESQGFGAACSYERETRGVFTGDALVGLIGGTLDWQ
ncbi:MAG TPA: hypothetical protein VFY36_04500 [Solirubrobacteraceae bacterium]|nr:hypothetical protein [Solirubrobacteraceae bacterium]